MTSSQCFDCNICFDIAKEPVITLCGHLYCWSCIYKWFCYQNPSHQSPQQCPVCKAEISETTVVPLYGRGESPSSRFECEGEHVNIVIPPRPSGLGTKTIVTSSSTTQTQQLQQHQNLYYRPQLDYSLVASRYDYEEDFSDEPVAHSIGFGEMVYGRYFGNLNTYPNSYGTLINSNPRLRRQHMVADKSLGRISLFFFCCFVFCLFIF